MPLLWICCFLLGMAAASAAEPAPPIPWHQREKLSGDWGGLRDRWQERGIEFNMSYAAQVMGNVAGGQRRGALYEGLMEASMDLDLQKNTGWRGARLHVHGIWTHGPGPSGKLIGNELLQSSREAYDSVRLYDTWLEQRMADDQVSIRIGQHTIEGEFATPAVSAFFLNGALGYPAFIANNTRNGGPGFPMPALGIRLRWDFAPDWYWQAGVYDGDNTDSDVGSPRVNRHGTHHHLSAQQGWFSVYELGRTRHLRPGSTGLPGTTRLGAWVHTDDFVNHDQTTMHDNNWGVYIAWDQMVYRERDRQGLHVFARAGASPPNRNHYAWVLDAGGVYRGLIPGRDDDEVGAAFIYGRHSNRLDTTYESVVELAYGYKLSPAITLQPDVQWISRPAGRRDLEDAWALSLSLKATF